MSNETLKRFVAFAFSGADLLIETDLQGQILFSSGATSRFKAVTRAEHLADCFRAASAAMVRRAVDEAPEEGRSGPFAVVCEDQPAELALWRLRDTDRLRWTLRFASAPVAASEMEFAAAARTAILTARTANREPDLVLVWLDGMDEVRDTLGDREADAFFSALEELARFRSDSDAAGRIREGVIALVPADRDSLALLESEIDEIARSEGFERVSAVSRQIPAGDGDVDEAISVFMEAAAGFQPGKRGGPTDPFSVLANEARRITDARTRAIRLTIRNRMFEPYVQPIVNARSHAAEGHELLLRLPGGRSFAPGILMAERGGASMEIDMAMCGAALDYLRAAPGRPPLYVNLSAASIADPDFGGQLAALLSRERLPRGSICFEITETSQIRDFERVRAVIDQLRASGQKVALDDFGVGSASLEYLFRLPVDQIKLDGALVPRGTPSDWVRSLFRGMAEFAHMANVKIIAERVEHRWQAVMFAEAGFDYLQGFHFGRPEPLADLEARFPARARREGIVTSYA